MWQSDCGTYRVRVLRRCFRQMQRLAVNHAPIEVGTTVAGRYSTDGHHAVLSSIGPVTPDSSGTRSNFIRGVVGLKDWFTQVRRRFKGQRYRVGEWHSHPDALPIPSDVDDESQTELAKDKREKLPEAILVIVGGDLRNAPELGVFV